MNVLIYLLPIALFLGFIGLMAFVWALKSGQYEDMDGAGERILIEPATDPDLSHSRRQAEESRQGQ